MTETTASTSEAAAVAAASEAAAAEAEENESGDEEYAVSDDDQKQPDVFAELQQQQQQQQQQPEQSVPWWPFQVMPPREFEKHAFRLSFMTWISFVLAVSTLHWKTSRTLAHWLVESLLVLAFAVLGIGVNGVYTVATSTTRKIQQTYTLQMLAGAGSLLLNLLMMLAFRWVALRPQC